MATNSASTQAVCELCSQHFSDPRMLPCLHSFCYDCLVKHFDAEKSEHTCPTSTCKEAFEMPNGKIEALPKDFRASYVAEVAQYEEMVSGKSEVSCDRCGNSEESMEFKFCCTCCECLCSWCTKDHTRCLKTCKHELIDIAGEKKNQDERSLLNSIPHKVMNCPLHSDEVLKFYCKTCSELICRDCMALTHSGHSYNRIEAVAESEKQALLPIVEEAESAAGKLEDAMARGEKVIQSVQVKKKSVEDETNKCFKNLQETLRNRKESLLAKCSEVELSKMTALKLQHEEMKQLYDEITRVCGRIKEASEVYMPAEMLSAKGPMMDKLNLLMKQFNACSLDPCKSESMTTDFISMMIRGEIEKFGVVTAGSYAGNSTASLYMLQAIKGKEKKFTITTRDVEGEPYGRGGEVVRAKMQLLGNVNITVDGTVKDNKDGSYEISVTPQSVGEHQLSITVGNEPIKSSPFVISVREPRNYTSISALQHYSVSSQPWDVALGDNGEMFVVNYGYHCIQVLNKQGTILRTIGTSGSSGTGQLQFSSPSAIAIRGDVVYVADESNHRIQKLTTSGEHIATFGSYGSGEGQLYNPRGICIDPEGKLYISEYNNNRISVFGADGTFDHFITGNMSNPWGVAFDPMGNLHVVNYGSSAVTIFNPNCGYVKQYGNSILSRPTGIAIDSEGYVFIGENFDYRFIGEDFESEGYGFTGEDFEYTQPTYDYNGEYNYYTSGNTQSHGLQIFFQHNLIKTITVYKATGVTLDKDGFIYVCDDHNNQVVKY